MSCKHGQKSIFYMWGPITHFTTKPLQTGDSKYNMIEPGCESKLLMLSQSPCELYHHLHNLKIMTASSWLSILSAS